MNNKQIIISDVNDFDEFDRYIQDKNIHSIFLVCGNSIRNFAIQKHFDELVSQNKLNIVKFTDFSPNPKYEDVLKGISCFNSSNCDAIMSASGGSAIDIAKCIKAFYQVPYEILTSLNSSYSHDKTIKAPDFNKMVSCSQLPLICMPTTAGSGAEATHFAVMYFHNKKYSIANYCLRPDVVLFSPSVLETLPDIQKKSTFLDALTHSIESFWSVNSTDESMQYSVKALKDLLDYRDVYFADSVCDKQINNTMLRASYTAGAAINISKTTAGHAMSYKLTSEFNIPHGYAVAMCLKYVWMITIEKAKETGNNALVSKLKLLSELFGGTSITDGVLLFAKIIDSLITKKIHISGDICVRELAESVNVERLSNHPVVLTNNDIETIYRNIIRDYYEN